MYKIPKREISTEKDTVKVNRPLELVAQVSGRFKVSKTVKRLEMSITSIKRYHEPKQI